MIEWFERLESEIHLPPGATGWHELTDDQLSPLNFTCASCVVTYVQSVEYWWNSGTSQNPIWLKGRYYPRILARRRYQPQELTLKAYKQWDDYYSRWRYIDGDQSQFYGQKSSQLTNFWAWQWNSSLSAAASLDQQLWSIATYDKANESDSDRDPIVMDGFGESSKIPATITDDQGQVESYVAHAKYNPMSCMAGNITEARELLTLSGMPVGVRDNELKMNWVSGSGTNTIYSWEWDGILKLP